MSATAMHIDAILLIITTLSILVIVSEDQWFQWYVPRALGVLAGIFSFGQAMWLLGVWVPGASGFPLPRIGYDATICGLAIARAAYVVRESYRRRPAKRAGLASR